MTIAKNVSKVAGLWLALALAGCGGGAGSGPAPSAKATVRFAVGDTSAARTALAQARLSGSAPAAVVVTLERPSGDVAASMQRIALYGFGAGYVSEPLELEVGTYRLTQFVVVDASNVTLYAAPAAGADPALLAQVSHPLPIAFTVSQAVIHDQPVEVLPVGAFTPQQFGYAAFTFRVNAPAKSSTRVHFGPGPDGVYLTDDDEIVGYNALVFDERGITKAEAWYSAGDGPGPDGLWFTHDDVPGGWWWERETGMYGSNQGGPGADGLWRSEDDTVSSWESFTTATDGLVHLHGIYRSPGPDGIWFTGDDVMSGYYRLENAPNGAEVKRVNYASPGADGLWFTEDDVIAPDFFGSYAVSSFDGENTRWGSWDRQVSYVGPGADGVWFTADDDIDVCRVHEFGDGTQYWTRERVYRPQPGRPCFQPGDQLVGYSLATNTY